MKANLKGLGGIKGLLLAHGEKLGIAVVGACAAMLVYYSLLRDHLPDNRQATDLQNEISLAKSEVESFDWPKAVTNFPGEVRIAKPLEQKGDSLVQAEAYQSPTQQIGWDRPVVPPTVLRTDPVLLEVQDVEGHGGSGLLAFVDPDVRRQKMTRRTNQGGGTRQASKKEQLKQRPARQEQGRNRGRGGAGGYDREGYGGGINDPDHPKRRAVVGMVQPAGVPLQDYEEVRVAHWAIVVAKVPIKEQMKLYRDAFDNARGSNPTADMPQYLGYFVERAEIRPGEEDKDLKWEPVQVYNGKGEPIGRKPGVVSPETLFGKPEDLATNTKTKAGVVTDWAAQMPEVVDPRYLGDSVLAFPLPPLVGRDWGSEVTHSEIPLAIDAVDLEDEAAKPDAEKTEDAAEAEDADLFSGGAAPGMGADRRQSGYGGRGGFGGMEGGMRGMGGGRGYGGYGGVNMGGGYGGGRGRGGYGGEGYGGEGYGAAGRGGMSSGGECRKCRIGCCGSSTSASSPARNTSTMFVWRCSTQTKAMGRRFVGNESLDSAVISRVKKEKAARKSPTATPFRMTEWSKPSRTVSDSAGRQRQRGVGQAGNGGNSTMSRRPSYWSNRSITTRKVMRFKRPTKRIFSAATWQT